VQRIVGCPNAGDAGGSPVPRSQAKLAALAVANALGHIDAAARSAERRKALLQATRGRRFFEILYRRPTRSAFEGRHIVCRGGGRPTRSSTPSKPAHHLTS
jgi:hypothetical protein